MTLPERVTIYEVGPRDGLQNERRWCRPRSRPSSSAGCSPPGCRSSRRPASCTRSGCPQLADAAELMTRARRRDGRELPGAGAQRARPRPGARARAAAHRDLRLAPPRRSRRRTSTAASTSSSRCSSRPSRRARDAGLDVRAYVSMCFGDPWEGAVPVEQVVDGRQAAASTSAPASSASATPSASAPPATSRALVDAFVDAGMATDQLAMHFHDTYGQALANAYAGARRPASRRSTPAPAASAAAPTPRAPPATSPPRTWSGCCTGLGIEHGVDLDAVVATSVWMAGQLGRPSPSAVVRAVGPRAGTITRMSRDRGLPAHRGPEDRDDLPPGPAGPQRQDAGRARRPLPDAVAAGQPGDCSSSAPRSTCSTRTGAARPGTPTGSWDALVAREPARSGTVVISHEILAPARARAQSRGR